MMPFAPRLPAFIECPRCGAHYQRGPPARQSKCPYCRAVFPLADVRRFLRWEPDGRGAFGVGRSDAAVAHYLRKFRQAPGGFV